MRALAIVLLASGCHAAPTPALPREPVTVELMRYSEASPTLVAIRDGVGPWRPVTFDNGLAHAAIASDTYDLATACDSMGVTIERVHTSDLAPVIDCFPSEDLPDRQHVFATGTVSGTLVGLQVWVWSAFSTAKVGADGRFRIEIDPAERELVVGEGSFDGKELHVRRVERVPVHGEWPVYADLVDGEDTVEQPLAVEGLRAGEPIRVMSFAFASGSGHAQLSLDSSPPYVVDLPPSSMLRDGVISQVGAVAGTDADRRRAIASGSAIDLGPRIGAVDVSRDGASYHAKLRAYPARHGDYWLNLSQGPGERHAWGVRIPMALEPDAGPIDIEVPSIELPGWERYALDPHAAVEWELMAGDFRNGASTSGQIPP